MENPQNYNKPVLEIPTNVIELPTGGRFYKEKQETVTIEMLVGQDEDMITAKRVQDNPNQFCIELIRRKVKDLRIPPEDLLPIDADYIMFNMIVDAFGPIITERVENFNNEGEIIEVELDIRKDFEQYFPSEYSWDEENTTWVKLPMTNQDVRFGMLTIGERARAVRESKAKKMSLKNFLMMMAVKEIKTQKGESIKDKIEIKSYLDYLPLKDSRFLEKSIVKAEPRIQAEKEIVSGGGDTESFRRTFEFNYIHLFQS